MLHFVASKLVVGLLRVYRTTGPLSQLEVSLYSSSFKGRLVVLTRSDRTL